MIDYKNINKVFFVNLLSTALGFINTILIGHFYGIGSAISAYFAATVLFGALAKVSQTGTISEYFFSRYFKVKNEHGRDTAFAQYAVLCNWLLIFTSILIIGGLLFSRVIISFTIQGLDDTTQEQAITIFKILIYSLPLQVLAGVFQTLLNSEKVYGKSELSSTLSMLISILIMLIWGSTQNPLLLVYTTYIGGIVQLIFIFYLLRKINYRHLFVLKTSDFGFKSIFSGFTITTIYALAVQMMTLCLTNSISKLPNNTFPIYKYIETIYSRIAGVVLRPLGLSFYTNINNLVTEGSLFIRENVQHNLNFTFLIGSGVLAISLLTGNLLVSVLWAGQPLTVTESFNAALLLQVYCFLIIVMGSHQVYRKLFIAVGHSRILYLTWIAEHSLMALILYFLIPMYGFYAMVGVIIAHTILMTLAPALLTKFKYAEYFSYYQATYVLKVIMSGTAASIITYFSFKTALHTVFVLNNYIRIVSMSTLFTILYLGAGYLLQIPNIKSLFTDLNRRWHQKVA